MRTSPLGIIPVGIGLLLAALYFPWSVSPDEVPLPRVDARAIAAVEAGDRALAAASTSPFPDDVRALGRAMRSFNSLQAGDDPRDDLASALYETQLEIAKLRREVLRRPDARPMLLRMRAVQLEAFLGEVRKLDATGKSSPELGALAGGFPRAMESFGWRVNGRTLIDESELRVVYKEMWDVVTGMEDAKTYPEFALELDERRVFLRLQLQRPHVPEATRRMLLVARAAAPSDVSCASYAGGMSVATETFRIAKVEQLGALDPEYPKDFAKGVLQYRKGEFGAAAASFRTYAETHPNGAYTLRARNFLRASLSAEGSI